MKNQNKALTRAKGEDEQRAVNHQNASPMPGDEAGREGSILKGGPGPLADVVACACHCSPLALGLHSAWRTGWLFPSLSRLEQQWLTSCCSECPLSFLCAWTTTGSKTGMAGTPSQGAGARCLCRTRGSILECGFLLAQAVVRGDGERSGPGWEQALSPRGSVAWSLSKRSKGEGQRKQTPPWSLHSTRCCFKNLLQ